MQKFNVKLTASSGEVYRNDIIKVKENEEMTNKFIEWLENNNIVLADGDTIKFEEV